MKENKLKVKIDGGGKRFNSGKARIDLVPPGAIYALAKVLEYGASKYDAHNWRRGMAWSTVYACAMRHLTQFWMCEPVDKESNLSHLYHAIANLAILIEYEKTCPELDDRFKAAQMQSDDFIEELGSYVSKMDE